MKETDRPMLSIIVPIYKVEKYLSRCIDSILAQSFNDYELILIDDGSPDHSAEIIEEYSHRDKRLITIHQKNQGVSAARNAGLRIANGKYIGFVDPDDWIDMDMYKTMVNSMIRENVDIVCCNWNDALADGTVKENKMPTFPVRMGHSDFINHIFDMPYSFLGVVWNKLFKRDIIQSLFLVGCAMGEDTLFTIQYALSVQKAYYINARFYNVFARADSAMRAMPEKMAEGLEVWGRIAELVKFEEKKTRRLSQKMYLDKCLLFSKLDGEAGTRAIESGRKYVKKHFFSVMTNREIYWKTRIHLMLRLL